MSLFSKNFLGESGVRLFIQNEPALSDNFIKFNQSSCQNFFSKNRDLNEVTAENLAVINEFSSKLFKIVQIEAANGNFTFMLDEAESPLWKYFELPSFKESIIGKPPITFIIKQLFSSQFQIEIEAGKKEWQISSQPQNPLLIYEPDLEPSCSNFSILQSYLLGLCLKAPDADVTFLIEGKEIKAHKLFLNQSIFFKILLEKEQQRTSPLAFESYTVEVFKAMLHFLYTFEINEHDAKNVKLVIELYHLSNFIQHKPLIDYCRGLLENLIDEQSFIPLAVTQDLYNDEFLHDLCRCFIIRNFDYGKTLNISNLTTPQIKELYSMAVKFKAKELQDVSLKELDKRFEGITDFNQGMESETLWSSTWINSFIQENPHLNAAFLAFTQHEQILTCPSELRRNTDLEETIIGKISEFSFKLFKVIQVEAAKGNTGLVINEIACTASSVIEYFDLSSSFNDSYLKEEPIANIIKQLFRARLDVEIEIGPDEWKICWRGDNANLIFPPHYEREYDLNLISKAYRIHWCMNAPDADVTFLIEGQKIGAHKIFLKQSAYFRNLFEYQTNLDSIPMHGFRAPVFKAMLHFLYTFEINENDEGNAKLVAELYALAQSIKFLPLIEYCQLALKKLMDEKNFLIIAYCLEAYSDQFLFNLCRWFVIKNFDYGKKVDISHFTPFQLMETYRIAEKFEAPQLRIASLMRLKECLDSELDVTELDQLLINMKKENRLEWLLISLNDLGNEDWTNECRREFAKKEKSILD